MNEFFTWQFLATMAGCTAATTMVTEALKRVFTKLHEQILSYIVALALLTAATCFTSGIGDWSTAALLPLNALIVSLASNGAYDAAANITGAGREK